jgi:hypothetical protein
VGYQALEPMRHGQTSDAVDTISGMKTWIVLFIAVVSTSSAFATGHNYKYSDLLIRDYDEMSKEVQVRIRNAHKANKDGEDSNGDAAAIEELRDALKLIFSRPNSDNMVAKLTPDVRRELSGFSAFEDTISSLTAESLGIADDKNATVSQRSTALFILDNILSEIRPEIGGNEDLRRVVQRIADAHVKIGDDVIKDRKIRSMFKTKNPTEYAEEILKANPKKAKK